MEKNKQMQIGGGLLMVAIALLGSLYAFGVIGASEADQIRTAAAGVAGSQQVTPTNPATAQAIQTGQEYSATGNIPETNVNVALAAEDATSIKYDQDKYDFGVAEEGEIVKHSYKFKNTGDKPLIIENAKASCGCTVPTWPKQPVPPGGTGQIDIEFNTKGKPGNQSKRVTITANTNPTQTFLQISGTVRGREQPAAKGN